MGCLWCGKYSRQCKTMPSGPPEFIPPFIPVTGMMCSYDKISSPLTEISGTEPARPLIWTHWKLLQRIYRWGEISETESARSTGLIWRGPEISVFPTEISVSGLEILPYEHFIPVTGMNGGMNSGGPDGIVLQCLLYFPHHKHPI